MNGPWRDEWWRQVLTEQIRQHARLYFRLAWGILRDPAGAEDVCQQAFLKAWSQRAEIADVRSLRAWLARVIVNESLQAQRRQKIEQRGIRARVALVPREQEPSSEDADRREAVLTAMQELPEETRLIVALRVMQGLTGNQVKDLLGCGATEVSRQLHAGMQRLRELLAEWNWMDDGLEAARVHSDTKHEKEGDL